MVQLALGYPGWASPFGLPDHGFADGTLLVVVRLLGLDEVAFTVLRVEDGQQLHVLAGIAVERLPGTAFDHDLVTILEPQDEVGILVIEILLPELLRRLRHRRGVRD